MNLKVPHFKFMDFQLWFWLNCSKTFKTELNLESYSTSTYTTYCLRLEIVISTTLRDKNLLCCTSAEGGDLSNMYHFLDQSQKYNIGTAQLKGLQTRGGFGFQPWFQILVYIPVWLTKQSVSTHTSYMWNISYPQVGISYRHFMRYGFLYVLPTLYTISCRNPIVYGQSVSTSPLYQYIPCQLFPHWHA